MNTETLEGAKEMYQNKRFDNGDIHEAPIHDAALSCLYNLERFFRVMLRDDSDGMLNDFAEIGQTLIEDAEQRILALCDIINQEVGEIQVIETCSRHYGDSYVGYFVGAKLTPKKLAMVRKTG